MISAQPDHRIRRHELGSLRISGKNFVVNTRRGVPRNACIELVNGSLRCWASHEYLNEEAAAYVRERAEYVPENNAFVWRQ